MVEGTPLLREHTPKKCIEGSNPSLSARKVSTVIVQSLHFACAAFPYQHHATMEPMNATALYSADRCEAWVPTQNGETALALPKHQACRSHSAMSTRCRRVAALAGARRTIT